MTFIIGIHTFMSAERMINSIPVVVSALICLEILTHKLCILINVQRPVGQAVQVRHDYKSLQRQQLYNYTSMLIF